METIKCLAHLSSLKKSAVHDIRQNSAVCRKWDEREEERIGRECHRSRHGLWMNVARRLLDTVNQARMNGLC